MDRNKIGMCEHIFEQFQNIENSVFISITWKALCNKEFQQSRLI